MIKRVYELTSLAFSDIGVYEAKGGNVGLRFTIDPKTDATVVLDPKVALMVKRGLARLVDADVADALEGGFSIKELVALRKAYQAPGVAGQDIQQITEIIDAYIRLIEVTTNHREKAEHG